MYLYEDYSTQDIAKLFGFTEPLPPLVFTPPPITDLKKPDGLNGYVDTVHLEKMCIINPELAETFYGVHPGAAEKTTRCVCS